MPPSYRGAAIFGLGWAFMTNDPPRDEQLNGFFGLDGIERIDGGSRGRETVVNCVLFGDGPGGLSAAVGAVRAMKDGQSGDLVDSIGDVWPDVVLQSYEPQGRPRSRADGTWFRQYQIRFLHLT